MSLRDKILSCNDLPLTPLFVPAWDETVYVRPLKVGEMNRLAGGNNDTVWQVIALSLCNEDGTPIFRKEDLPKLDDKNGTVRDLIIREVTKLSTFDASKVDAMEKP